MLNNLLMISRFLLGTSLLCGGVIISRPPALFPVNDNDTKNATNSNETSDRKLVTGSHHVKVDYCRLTVSRPVIGQLPPIKPSDW